MRSKWNKLNATQRRILILKDVIPLQEAHICKLRVQLERAEGQLIADSLKLRQLEEVGRESTDSK